MKNSGYLIIIVLAVGLLFCATTTVFACEGDKQTPPEPQRTGIKSNGSYGSASSGVTFDRDPEYVFMNWYHNRTIKEDRFWLVVLQRTEATMDGATFLANAGVTGHMVYCFTVGGVAIVFPISLVWQFSKLSSRSLYGATLGNMNTVKRLNEQTWAGRRANNLINLVTGEVQISMMARREERRNARREEAASSNISGGAR